MASFRQHGEIWYFRYVDASGKQVERKGHWDKKTAQAMARKAEDEVAQVRSGLIDPRDVAYRAHEARPLTDHVADWQADLLARGFTAEHAGRASNRVRRLVAMMRGSDTALLDHCRVAPGERGEIAKKIVEAIRPARLSDLNREKIQGAIARFRDSGWSLQTCNHYRASIKAFAKWCYDTDRIRDALRGVKSFNVKEDRRHDRRTISLQELRKLIDAAHRGAPCQGLSGPIRALCYRTAAATGLRFSELSSVKPESFDWDAPSVTVAAGYTKNRRPTTLPMPHDLAEDLRPYVATIKPGSPIFPLPKGKGSRLIRRDLKAAGIPYRDAAGLVFDFHSLRCELATLADAAGISPRTVQRMMRHSSLELTDRYSRIRAVDIEAATSKLPSLKPQPDQHTSKCFSLHFPYEDAQSSPGESSPGEMLANPHIDPGLKKKEFGDSCPDSSRSDLTELRPGKGVHETPIKTKF
jgi:integrase